MKKPIYLLIVLVSTVSWTACGTVQEKASFDDVDKMVHARISQRVVWSKDESVQASVRRLLKEELTPDTAVRVALLNNPRMQAVYEDLGIAQAELVEAGLLKNPSFEGDFRFVEGGEGEIYEMALLEDLVNILMIPLRKQMKTARLEAMKTKVASQAMGLAFEVKSAFYRHQADVQVLEMMQTVFTAAEASYEMAKRLREAGNIVELQLFNEQALYEQTKLGVNAAEVSVLEGRERLNVLMGIWGKNAEWKVAPSLPEIKAVSFNKENLEKQALQNSLDLAMARYRIQQAAAIMEMKNVTSVMPELELGISSEREADGTWSVGPAVSLPIPIFNHGLPDRSIARARLRKEKELYAHLAIDIRAAVRSAFYRLNSGRQRAKFYKEIIVPLRKNITTQTHLRYNAMQLGVFQLLETKQMEILAQRRYIETLRDYWLAHTELNQLINGNRVTGTTVDFSGIAMEMSVASGGEGH